MTLGNKTIFGRTCTASSKSGFSDLLLNAIFVLAACIILILVLPFFCSGGDGGSGSGLSSSSSGGGGSGNDIANYKKKQIGSQVWMAENLNYNVSGSKCYGNTESNCAKYGRLYDWATAMALPAGCNSSSCASQVGAKHRGICPSGWHIPSNDDWNVLMKHINPSCSNNNMCAGVGTKLKATSGWNANGNGTDEFGFSSLPGGSGGSDGNFSDVGNGGVWWSSTEDDSGGAYRWSMYCGSEYVIWDGGDKGDLFNVRCLQD